MKKKIIEQIQQQMPGRTTKEQAEQMLRVVTESIVHVAKNNDGGAQVLGFGTFTVGTRAGRTVRVPMTKELIQTQDKRVLKFRVSKSLVL